MHALRTLSILLLAAGCAVQGSKEELPDPSFADGDDSADAFSRRLDYRGAIHFGETLEGTYSETGFSGYAFVGREDANVSLSIAGGGSDPMLYVYGPKRGDTWSRVRRIAMNDDFGGSVDSHVTLALPADGTYLVLAREYWGDAGSFSLTLDCDGEECRAECDPSCPTGAACEMVVCVRAPCPSYCAVEGDAPPPTERICGTRGVEPCNAGEYCDYPESAACGATDAPGVCREIPTVCTREVSPVCGCDGETYTNGCNANARGVSVAHDGECASEPEPAACVVGGCSSQVCAEDTGEPIITTCEWRAEYACLRQSRCERQADGACGWTQTAEYRMCMDALASDCRTAGCGAGRYCSYCWGSYQCIPDGAVC